jgi:hypothetical protein
MDPSLYRLEQYTLSINCSVRRQIFQYFDVRVTYLELSRIPLQFAEVSRDIAECKYHKKTLTYQKPRLRRLQVNAPSGVIDICELTMRGKSTFRFYLVTCSSQVYGFRA